ncbi:hypothetical protein [Rhizosaccharibacter radicis]
MPRPVEPLTIGQIVLLLILAVGGCAWAAVAIDRIRPPVGAVR